MWLKIEQKRKLLTRGLGCGLGWKSLKVTLEGQKVYKKAKRFTQGLHKVTP